MNNPTRKSLITLCTLLFCFGTMTVLNSMMKRNRPQKITLEEVKGRVKNYYHNCKYPSNFSIIRFVISDTEDYLDCSIHHRNFNPGLQYLKLLLKNDILEKEKTYTYINVPFYQTLEIEVDTTYSALKDSLRIIKYINEIHEDSIQAFDFLDSKIGCDTAKELDEELTILESYTRKEEQNERLKDLYDKEAFYYPFQ